jgi:hypothetical protein
MQFVPLAVYIGRDLDMGICLYISSVSVTAKTVDCLAVNCIFASECFLVLSLYRSLEQNSALRMAIVIEICRGLSQHSLKNVRDIVLNRAMVSI